MAKRLSSKDELISFAMPQHKISNSIMPFKTLVQGEQNDLGFNVAKGLAFSVGIHHNSFSFDHGFYQNCGISNSFFSHQQPSEEDKRKSREIISTSNTWNAKEHHAETSWKKTHVLSFSRTPCELLNKCSSGFKRLTDTNEKQPCKEHILTEPRKTMEGGKPSAHEIMKVAAKTFLESYQQTTGGHSSFSQLDDLPFSVLSKQEVNNVMLVRCLLTAAVKVEQQEYELSDIYLDRCDRYSSNIGSPVERVVYYVCKALREKVDLDTGRISEKGLVKKQSIVDLEDILVTVPYPPNSVAQGSGTPFLKINQHAGVQTILENVKESKKVHVIDLSLRFTLQWMHLIESLGKKGDVEHLKITSVGTTSKRVRDKTGKQMMSFAESKKLQFSYNTIELSDFLELTEEILEIKADEAVAVYSEFGFERFIVLRDRLDHIMKIISKIRPRVMVVIENNIDGTSPSFSNRFINSLLFMSAYFDCFGECFDQESRARMILESLFGEWIRKILGTMEGGERMIKNVTLDVWKETLRRYGLKETEFSMSTLYQVNLLTKRFPHWKHCTLEMNGRSLVACWKGVVIHFASIWKFD